MTEVQLMPSKKQEFSQEDWIPVQKAADIISANSGHTVSPDYVRGLGNQGRIETWVINSRMKLYKRSDVYQIVVKLHERKEDK